MDRPRDQEEVPPPSTRPINVTIRFLNGREAGTYEFLPSEKGELIDATRLLHRIYNSLKKWQMKWIKRKRVQQWSEDLSPPGGTPISFYSLAAYCSIYEHLL